MLRLYPLRRSFSLDIAPDDSNSNFLQNNDDVTGDTPATPPTTSSNGTSSTAAAAAAAALTSGSLASTVMTQLSPSTPLPVSNHISAAHQILLNKQVSVWWNILSGVNLFRNHYYSCSLTHRCCIPTWAGRRSVPTLMMQLPPISTVASRD